MTVALEMRPSLALRGAVRPPGSKSLTNRALVCAALAQGESRLTGILESEDTRVMVAALQALGVPLSVDWPAARIVVEGQAGKIPASAAQIFVANSGTTVRFLAAMLALGQGEYRLDGTPRMRERPIQDLLDSLRTLGADAVSEPGTGCPPVLIRARGLSGGRAEVRGDVSSQFLSGLLLAAPYARDAVELVVTTELVSQPYIDMTLAVMSQFGVPTQTERDAQYVIRRVQVPRQNYLGRTYPIEPDASAASYFFAAAAITGGTVTVRGLTQSSLQGDVMFAEALQKMGCELKWDAESVTVIGKPLRGITLDMNAISDTVMTLAATALFATGPTTIAGVAHIRHKETDRLAALATELRKLGARVEEFADGLTITPGPLRGATIATYQDHRMAMSLALVGLRVPGVVILDPACTAKTYPGFFLDLARLAGQPEYPLQ